MTWYDIDLEQSILTELDSIFFQEPYKVNKREEDISDITYNGKEIMSYGPDSIVIYYGIIRSLNGLTPDLKTKLSKIKKLESILEF